VDGARALSHRNATGSRMSKENTRKTMKMFNYPIARGAALLAVAGRLCIGFTVSSTSPTTLRQISLCSSPSSDVEEVTSIDEASKVLQAWDRLYNPDNADFAGISMEDLLEKLEPSVMLLNKEATELRQKDSTKGRVMLGICASSAAEGVQTLKSWVTALELPRGLLHGLDKDGVPIELEGAVYIKYNSGGVYTFADIRKSGLGFDALWKPGDAMVEPYEDGNYRGVYFQVELADSEFRQYLVPLDLFQL